MSDMLPEFITVRTQRLVTVLAEAKFSPSVILYGDARAQAIAAVRALPLTGRETIALPEPADRWAYTCLQGADISISNTAGAEGWEAYAAAFNADGKQVIWMKRRLP